MKKQHMTRQGLFSWNILLLYPLFFFSFASVAAATVGDLKIGDLNISATALKKQLAECELNEAKLHSLMPKLRGIWENTVTLEKEYNKLELQERTLKKEWEETDKVLNESNKTYGRLAHQCADAWKKSGMPDGEYKHRWKEIKECSEFEQFNKKDYWKLASINKAKRNELEKKWEKIRIVGSKRMDIQNEYRYALQPLGYYDVNTDPNTYLRNITDRCNKLRAMHRMIGYDPAVRAQKAIKECRFTEADKYIAEMPAGPERTTLEKNIAAARAQAHKVYLTYQEGKAIYNKGKTEEIAGRYESARTLYQEAHGKFTQARNLEICERRLPTIYKALSITQKRIAEVTRRRIAVRPRGTQRFDKPIIGGVRVDGCLTWAKDCGKPAADEFCRRNHFSEAESWKTDVPVPKSRVITSGRICETGKNWPTCGAFSYIICK